MYAGRCRHRPRRKADGAGPVRPRGGRRGSEISRPSIAVASSWKSSVSAGGLTASATGDQVEPRTTENMALPYPRLVHNSCVTTSAMRSEPVSSARTTRCNASNWAVWTRSRRAMSSRLAASSRVTSSARRRVCSGEATPSRSFRAANARITVRSGSPSASRTRFGSLPRSSRNSATACSASSNELVEMTTHHSSRRGRRTDDDDTVAHSCDLTHSIGGVTWDVSVPSTTSPPQCICQSKYVTCSAEDLVPDPVVY